MRADAISRYQSLATRRAGKIVKTRVESAKFG